MRRGSTAFLALSTLVVLVAPVRADRSSASVLAGQVLGLFQRHCLECHGPRATEAPRLLDRTELVESLKALVPGRPEVSELNDFVAGGIMPPGLRPKVSRAEQLLVRDWILAGAPALAGENYILGLIAADSAAQKPTDLPFIRYFSLNHLLAAGKTSQQLEKQRSHLTDLLRHLSGQNADLLTALDPAGTVFRFDLRRLGWDRKPLNIVDFIKSPDGKSRLTTTDQKGDPTLYDLLLLDYPYALLPRQSEVFSTVARTYLRSGQLIRPIPYVRGDWFLAVASQGALHELLLNKKSELPLPGGARELYDAPIDLVQAQAELGLLIPREALKRDLAGKKFGKESLDRLTEGKTVSRIVWERAFPAVVAELNLGVPIYPDDGILTDDSPRAQPFAVEIKTREVKSNRFTATFQVDDELKIYVVNSAQDRIFLEVQITTDKGKKFRLTKPVALAPGKSWEYPEEGHLIFRDDDVGSITITVFASKTEFNEAQWLRDPAKPPVLLDRLVHRFYELDDSGQLRPGTDSGQMVRQSLKIEIRPKP